jgi:hypothetical protein|tara:strand:+ start:8435 stop:9316 length:882 start_codon:yes stop_codon:yes gene_type:complete
MAGYKAFRPQTRFGNTFGTPSGSYAMLEDWDYFGEIDYSKLNRRRFRSETHFTEFYKIIQDFIMARLGFPVVRVELTDFQIETAIEEAISTLDYHAPDWCVQLCTFATVPGVSLYELPQVVMNNFRYATYRKNLLSVAQANNTLEFDFFIKYFQDNFLFQDFSVGDFYIVMSHLEMIRKILGNDGSFIVVNGRYLNIAPTPAVTAPQEVIVEFKALDSDTLHPFFINWIQKFACSVSKTILGQIRGKYQVLPSPGGGAQLNGEQLVREGNEEKALLMQALLTEIEEPAAFSTF